MSEESRRAIASSLGCPERDFSSEPLSQKEITAVIITYVREIDRLDLDPELREVYVKCIEFLKKQLIYH